MQAGIVSMATFTDTQPTVSTYEYTITLTNTGTTTIGTFWFSWVPGAGFMSVAPTNVQSPAGWTDILTNANSAIQWKTATNLLAPGSSVSGFMFDSTLSPAALEAAFPGPGTGAGDPLATYFNYIAAPLADPGFQGVATPATSGTPEPATITLVGLALGLGAIRKFAR